MGLEDWLDLLLEIDLGARGGRLGGGARSGRTEQGNGRNSGEQVCQDYAIERKASE
jgi:hypothetical protein